MMMDFIYFVWLIRVETGLLGFMDWKTGSSATQLRKAGNGFKAMKQPHGTQHFEGKLSKQNWSTESMAKPALLDPTFVV